MKLATCNEPWRDKSIEEVFQIAARIGYEGVEIAPFLLAERVDDISAERRREINRAAKDAGVEMPGLHWLFASPPGLHLTSEDDQVRRKSAEYLEHLADFCADLGGKVMIFGSPKQRNFSPPTTYEQAWQRAKDVYSAAADTLAKRDVTLCIEGLSPKETNFIQTVDEAARMADEIGHPNIDIMLDIKAMATMPDGVIGTIKKYGSRAKHFHANQPHGEGVGMPVAEGEQVDLKPIMEALKESGYDGWVSVEPFDYNPDPDTVAETGLETLKQALGE
jgi:sugar phosphate isomerase/epimerase